MNVLAKNVFDATDTAARLLNDYASGGLSHAYMIIGNTGAGKRTLTYAFAKLIMCESPHGNSPCNECAACRYFDSFGTHPELTTVRLTDKASIGVEDIRKMSDGVYTAPYIGAKKVYVIENAEKMTAQAQNALLKIIEEPPEYVVFFLLTSNRYAMLQTVISRCRVLNMSRYSETALKNIALEHNSQLSHDEINVLLHRCQGLPGRLISFIDAEDKARETVFDAVRAILNGDIDGIFEAAARLETRDAAISFAQSLNEIMRDASVYSVCKNEGLVFNADKTELIEEITQKATLKHITDFLSEIIQTIKMLSGNVSYQLCIKNLLMKW